MKTERIKKSVFEKNLMPDAGEMLRYHEMTGMYYGHDLQEAFLQPINMVSKYIKKSLHGPFAPLSNTMIGKSVAANLEMVERLTHHYEKPQWHFEQMLDHKGDLCNIKPTKVLQKDFCTLVHFKKEVIAQGPKSTTKNAKGSKESLPTVLIVAPYSGHFATLLRDTVRAMLPAHDVYITDWANARDVPIYKGTFYLEDYIQYLMDFIAHINDDVHMIAVCQPAVPTLAMAGILNQQKSSLTPKSMTLMGGPIDTRRAPTAVNRLSKEKPIEWFEQNIVGRVPCYYGGAYRRVIPGFIMLAGFMNLNLEKHISAPRVLFNHMVKGDADSADAHRQFYDEYRSVLDLPADYFLDSVRTAFQEHLLPRGLMTWKGERIDLKSITKTALMTVEGERDDISGPGQTVAAHDMCPNIPEKMRAHLLQAEVGHYGVFNGRRWREFIQPRIAKFIQDNR